ncbi:transposase [Deinococcus sp. QL22]|uniref:transposase n=1 Tax=Deinococcus sp. QL22 TaxID=2939437 RepID=UPI0020179912|nr:transposase [Deinococcus sp. QL22]UQN10638.1 transposase [Deinococcus sp. QL22]
MTPRRIFNTEYKREAVHLTQRPGMTVTQAARDLGIGISTLQRWLREASQQGDAAFPGVGRQHLTPEQEEIRRLRKEVEILREEREILKKVTAFFAKQSR